MTDSELIAKVKNRRMAILIAFISQL